MKMNLTEILNRLEETTQTYIQELEPWTIEQLQRQPNEGEWSLGQMYQHLIQAALFMQLRNAELCVSQAPEENGEAAQKTEAGKAVFDQNGFPPVRIQVPPSPQYTPSQPTSKEQLIDGLNAVVQRMKEFAPQLKDMSSQQTVMHPRLGALHAAEWFALVEMHYRHHLLQLGRLKAFLAS